MESEGQRLRDKGHTLSLSLVTLALTLLQLHPGLFAVPDVVISTEWDLFAIGEQDFLAALHQVLLVEGPGIHEILQHDHEDIFGEGTQVQSSIGEAACRA